MSTSAHTRTVEVVGPGGAIVGSKEVVLYAGLLAQAHDEHLARIKTSIVQLPTPENGHLAVIKAEVETEKGLFEAFGDASPDSVELHLIPHLIRVAETRAKARALRDAVNVGVVSYEELDGVRLTSSPSPGPGALPPSRPAPRSRGIAPPRPNGNGSDQMTEGQRRYLFRLMAGQGLRQSAAEEHLKSLFSVSSLSEVSKAAAGEMIDRLLQSAPQNGGGGNGSARPLH